MTDITDPTDSELLAAFERAKLTFGPMGTVCRKATREGLLRDEWIYLVGIQPLDGNGMQDVAKPFMEIMSSTVSWNDAFEKFAQARQDFWSALL